MTSIFLLSSLTLLAFEFVYFEFCTMYLFRIIRRLQSHDTRSIGTLDWARLNFLQTKSIGELGQASPSLCPSSSFAGGDLFVRLTTSGSHDVDILWKNEWKCRKTTEAVCVCVSEQWWHGYRWEDDFSLSTSSQTVAKCGRRGYKWSWRNLVTHKTVAFVLHISWEVTASETRTWQFCWQLIVLDLDGEIII